MPNYLYNGIELPALPEWDKEAYPYAVIDDVIFTDLSFEKWLYVFPVALEGWYGDVAAIKSTPYQYQIYVANESEFVYKETREVGSGSTFFTTSVEYLVWSNHDIYAGAEHAESGKLMFAASDPVPVLALTERDLYRKINGQPTKLTLYKKVGGELVALDEYTQGGNL